LSFIKGHTLNIKKFYPITTRTKVAIETAEGGGEVATIRIINVATKQFYKDAIYPALYGVSGWLNDSAVIYTAILRLRRMPLNFI